jgi:quercetin dioxygenase-like cupin family protein
MTWITLALAVVAAPIVAVSAIAQETQQGGIKRTLLQTIDFPPGYETVSVIGEIKPGDCAGRHTHPGAETAYVLEGEIVVKIDGKPDFIVKAGQPLLFAPGVVHNECNLSDRLFKALATYVVEKGEPLASPAL